jgi:hypothetical protein
MDTKVKKCLSPKTKRLNKLVHRRNYRNSEKGHKKHRIWDWEFKNKIVGDYDVLYDIVQNTHYCENKECNKKLAYRGSKPSHNSKCLDHCHNCGLPRGILCNNCNLKNVLKCVLCDLS